MKRNSLSRAAYLARLSMLLAIVVVFTVFNIANIPVGPIVATVYQVPVVIGAVALGTKAGALLGGVWGALCFWLAVSGQTTDVVALAAVAENPLGYFLVAFLPRLLTGLFAGLLYELFSRLFKKENSAAAYLLSGALGSLVNTVCYLGMLWLLFRGIIASAYSIELSAVLAMVLGVAATNGLAEAAVCAILTAAVCKALAALDRKKA